MNSILLALFLGDIHIFGITPYLEDIATGLVFRDGLHLVVPCLSVLFRPLLFIVGVGCTEGGKQDSNN